VRRALLGSVCLVVGLGTACRDSTDPDFTSAASPLVPEIHAQLSTTGPGDSIPDQYIIVLKDDVRDVAGEAKRQLARHGGRLHFTYDRSLKGYAATLSRAEVARLRKNAKVKYIEADRMAQGSYVQSSAVWGLDRIDQRYLPLNSSFTYARTGLGVRIYVLDSGIRRTHQQFGGRALAGADFVKDGRGTSDCNGHGTHVAGTAAGTTYGVAKQATLVPVRVLGCDNRGSWSRIIAGIDWVTANARKPAVVNMSLGGSGSRAVDDAVARSINAGVVYTIAAMNDAGDACNYSPARLPAALTVAASDQSDRRASFTNYGRCVDLYAPGASVLSSFNTSDVATALYWGTSMASPHVAGAAAQYLQAYPGATPAQVSSALIGATTRDRISNPGANTANRLLFTR
jgi:subtilisin family serine protease